MKPIIIIVIAIATLVFLIYLIAYMISPGSNSRAEYYRVNIPTNQIIEKVAEFKERYPDYKVYDLNEEGQPYEYIDKKSNSFFIYFPTEKWTAVCVVKQINKEFLIGLEGVFMLPNLRGFKGLNNGELPRNQNQEIKKVFEEKFLDRIGTWERVNTGNSFFGLYF